MLVYWASYVWFPFALVTGYLIARQKGVMRYLAVMAFIVSLPLAWARFIEPQLLITQTTQIDLTDSQTDSQLLRIALFADTQHGLFPNTMEMDRIVERILQQNVDAVFMAGDWLMESEEEDIPAHVAAIQRLTDADIPVYGVLGNHDIYVRYPPFSQALYSALRKVGVTLVENRAYEVELAGIPLIVSGASDLWRSQQNFSFSDNLPKDRPVLLLTHNPDTIFQVPDSFKYD